MGRRPFLYIRRKNLTDQGLDPFATVLQNWRAMTKGNCLKIVAIFLGQLPDAALRIFDIRRKNRRRGAQLAASVRKSVARNQETFLAM